MSKTEIRAYMRKLNREMCANERCKASETIFSAVEHLPYFAATHTIAVFCSLPDEPDTQEFINKWSTSKHIVLPRVEGDTMQFYHYDSTTLQTGAFGISEPISNRLSPSADIDMIVVPGVAFTREGARIGRGKGFYDKYMSQTDFSAHKVGVCYTHQIVDTLPVETHDIKVDTVCCG